MVDIPHWSLPFRFELLPDGTRRVAVTEQDSVEEVRDCVELILRTVQSERATLPEFGRPAILEFTTDRELARSLVQQAIDESEPRAQAIVEAAPVDTQDEGLLRLLAMYDVEVSEE